MLVRCYVKLDLFFSRNMFIEISIEFRMGGSGPNVMQEKDLSRSAAVNSLRTGMMAQFKSNFVAASSNSNVPISSSTKPALRGFVSGGSIGGEAYKAQSVAVPAFGDEGSRTVNGSQKGSESSRDRRRERKRPSGWDR
ncbi:hypothetical protein B296_00000735 [Ensete ventricosum]|uniref:Uncharacterized protein n=1 Tax=Ensete ventricosum TaxID=4639 RepID=A0A427BCE0_ENSVE|nr:hypothetical protein B296_00000735 [Ensete ventricosum]